MSEYAASTTSITKKAGMATRVKPSMPLFSPRRTMATVMAMNSVCHRKARTGVL